MVLGGYSLKVVASRAWHQHPLFLHSLGGADKGNALGYWDPLGVRNIITNSILGVPHYKYSMSLESGVETLRGREAFE